MVYGMVAFIRYVPAILWEERLLVLALMTLRTLPGLIAKGCIAECLITTHFCPVITLFPIFLLPRELALWIWVSRWLLMKRILHISYGLAETI